MENENNRKPDISIIMPALNEERNIILAINNSLKASEDFGISAEVVVVDDGSRDKTAGLVSEAAKKDSRIRILHHNYPMGIGASFWDGVDQARGDIVLTLPGDNENNPWEILRYYKLLEHVDFVVPFVFNKEARSLFRNALSYVYRFIINTTFLVNFNYTNGTVLYRRSLLKELDYHSHGFFFQTDILIRTAKKGYLFAEVPYQLGLRKAGISKAVTFPSFIRVAKGYFRLIKDYYFTRDRKAKGFAVDSVSAKRNKQ